MTQIDDPPPMTVDERRGRIKQLADDLEKHVGALLIALASDDLETQRDHGSVIELAAVELMDHLEELK